MNIDPNKSPWPSQQASYIFFNALVPGCAALSSLLYHAARLILPSKVIKVLSQLGSPFVDFLQLEDLHGPLGDKPPRLVRKSRSIVLCALLQALLYLALCIFDLSQHQSTRHAYSLILWAYILISVVMWPPHTTPYTLLVISTSFCLGSLVHIFYSPLTWTLDLSLAALSFLLGAAFTWISCTLPMKPKYPCPNVAKEQDMPSAKLTMPEDRVDLLEWMSFSFVEPILRLASSRTLNDIDVWSLSPYFTHKNLFEKQLLYRKMHPNHSLLWFLLSSNSLDLIIDTLLEAWTAVIGFVPPYALKQILASFSDDFSDTASTVSFWALVTFLAHLSFAQLDLFQRWHTRRCYERTRGQIFCALHYKALVRQDVAGGVGKDGEIERADLGKITNLMQGDAYALAHRFWEFSAFLLAPVRLCIALAFLYQVLGWSALCGVIIVLIAYLLNWPLAKYNVKITRFSWKAKDKRMNAVNELLQNVRFLKFFGWMHNWSAKVRDAREDELRWKVKENVVDTAITFIWTWMPSATALVTFWCYTVVAGERLTVSVAFTSIALFSQLQEPMTALPSQFFAMLHAYVSMQRIEHFLDEGEVELWATSLTTPDHRPSEDIIGFRSALLEWYESNSSPSIVPFRLGPLDVSLPKGKLTLICGPTGSGKTMYLSSLLGETRCIEGSVHLDKSNHKVAYCAQFPWLEHATIRDNIIFGSSRGYDEVRYKMVLEACALNPDLRRFDASDLTEIGEKGITLSGGQRARIALARALYSEAICILMDDPLAAVDMHTGRHIVRHCFHGPLSENRTMVLVTHHISLCLSSAAYVIELSQGKVVHQGTPGEFRAKGYVNELKAIEAESSQTGENQEAADDTDEGNAPRPQLNSSGKLIQEEARAEGNVTLKTYFAYAKALGAVSWTLLLILMLLIRAINIGNQLYLSHWAEAYENGSPATIPAFVSVMISIPPPDVNVWPWLLIYLAISLAGAFSVLAYIGIGYYASLQASRGLFSALLKRISRAPARFFDQTPVGRLLNRFTSDMNVIDNQLLNSGREALSRALNFLASFTVIVVIIPKFTPFAIFIAWLYIRLGPRYVRAARDLRRLESISLSPAFSGFDELLHGLAHIRAFGMEERYQNRFYEKVDKFQSFDHVYWLVNNWLRWRYDCLGSVVVYLTTMFSLTRTVSSSGLAAVAIVQAGIFAEASRQLVKTAAQLELDFNSVERVVEYMNVPQEAPGIIEDNRPPAYWPSSSGGLHVQDLQVQYAPDLPMVLKHISFDVQPSEKIGIVGRTGSGKSTLALSLLRMVEASGGQIILDGIDISKIGLEDLRSRITIVSQDVALFSGTLRSNIDVFNEHDDQECWDVIERCHLKPLLTRSSSDGIPSLDFPINATNSLSAGECQLIALARAILRRPSFIIFDEATSQIDSTLDDHIQKTMREEFASAMVLTIAHRIKTVLDYDRILVLDNGRVVEFDTPETLLNTPGGFFRTMYQNLTAS